MPSSAVPGIAFRKLTGIESASSSRNANATSTICSFVSPMPAMKPAHGEMPASLHRLDRRDPVLVGMRRRDPRVMVRRRVQVVVVSIYACLAEFVRLLGRKKTETGADLHRHLLFDPPHGTRSPRAAPVRSARARSRRRSTYGPSAPTLRAPLRRERPPATSSTAVQAPWRRRLRAVAAVLRADAALRVDEHVQLDAETEVRPTDPKSRVEQRKQLLVTCAQDSQRILPRKPFSRQDPTGHCGPARDRFQLRHAPSPDRGRSSVLGRERPTRGSELLARLHDARRHRLPRPSAPTRAGRTHSCRPTRRRP